MFGRFGPFRMAVQYSQRSRRGTIARVPTVHDTGPSEIKRRTRVTIIPFLARAWVDVDYLDVHLPLPSSDVVPAAIRSALEQRGSRVVRILPTPAPRTARNGERRDDRSDWMFVSGARLPKVFWGEILTGPG